MKEIIKKQIIFNKFSIFIYYITIRLGGKENVYFKK